MLRKQRMQLSYKFRVLPSFIPGFTPPLTGVYRITDYPADRLAQYHEAVLWAKASQEPESIDFSHETALLLYGISDANPSRVNLTVPTSARLLWKCPKQSALKVPKTESD